MLAQLVPRDREQQFPLHQSDWLLIFALMPSFSRETEFTKFVSEGSPQLVPIPLQSGVGSRWQIARAVVRAVTATKHEPGLSPSCRVCLARLSNGGLGPPEIVSLPACTRRSICRGAAMPSRLHPLAFSGDKRGRSKAPFFSVLNGTSISDPEPVNPSCDPESLAHGRLYLRDNRKRHHLRSHQLLRWRYGCTNVRPTSRMCGARFFAILRTPTR